MNEKKAIVEFEQRDVFIELDRRDEQQIVMHALGEVVDELFYDVKGKKRLSWEGINTIAYLMGDIEVDDGVQWERIEMFGDRVYWSATVRARNTRFNLASLGTAEAPERMEVYDRDDRNQKIPDPKRKGEFKTHLEPDEFCRRKALSKGQRNAKRAVMPTAVLKKYLQYFVDLKLFQKDTRREKPEMPFKPKTVDAEYQVLDVEKEELPPPRQEPRKETDLKLKPREPRVPGSLDEVDYILRGAIPNLDEILVITEYEDFFRIGKKKRLEEEVTEIIGGWIKRMKGHWDKDANCWKIPKVAEGR